MLLSAFFLPAHLLMALTVSADLATPLIFRGLCDASATVLLDGQHFAVADDEDNRLHIYQRHKPGLPVWSEDVSRFLRTSSASAESDIEGAARIGNRIYWITSHGANAKGKDAPDRHRLFATEIEFTNGTVRLQPAGYSYHSLLRDLAADPRYAMIKPALVATLPPKTPGALNIEGLGATGEGHLLVGFRNPIPGGRAMLARLLNPEEIVAGKAARLGEPLFLDLEGLGIRSIAETPDSYLIIAGSHDNEKPSILYAWKGGSDKPHRMNIPALNGLNPEGISFYRGPGNAGFLIVSDDGALKVGKKCCKNLKDPALKGFRSVWISEDHR